MPLTEDRRRQLDGVILKMNRQGSSAREMQLIVKDFKSKYSTEEDTPAPYRYELELAPEVPIEPTEKKKPELPAAGTVPGVVRKPEPSPREPDYGRKRHESWLEQEQLIAEVEDKGWASTWIGRVSGYATRLTASMIPKAMETEKPPIFIETATPKALWAESGEVGLVERVGAMNIEEKVPFSPAKMISSGLLAASAKRVTDNSYPEVGYGSLWKEYDQKIVLDYFLKLEEYETRGVTAIAEIGAGLSVLPAYMIEFLMTAGVASLGRKGLQKLGTKAVTKYGKRKVMAWAIKTGFKTAEFGLAATIRLPFFSHRVGQSYAERRLPEDIQVTAKGELMLGSAKETPFWAFAKATGDVWIELFSEMTGESITSGVQNGLLLQRNF